MEIQEKPDYLIFADGAKSGEISAFPNIERGWGITLEQTQGKPPLEWMNSAFNRIDKDRLYSLQQGVPEWDTNVVYPIGAIIKVNSVIYVAKTQNSNQNPVTSVNTWELLINDATTSKKGIVKLNSATNSNSETEAATPKAVKTAYDLANKALPLSGGTLTGALTGTDITGNNITAKTSLTVGSAKATYGTNGLNFDKELLINNTPVLKQGDYGLGGISSAINGSISTLMKSGFYAVTSATSGSNKPFDFGTITLNRQDATIQTAIATETTTGKLKSGLFLSGEWAWREIITTENISSYQSGLGINQTWQDVSSDRKTDVVYTNSTNKPIVVNFMVSSSGNSSSSAEIHVDNILVSKNTTRYNEAEKVAFVTAIVPPNSTYKIIGESGVDPKLTVIELR